MFSRVDEFIERSMQQESMDEMLRVFMAMVLSVLDKIKPQWEREVKTKELGLKAVEIALKHFHAANEMAQKTYEAAYYHYLSMMKRWFFPNTRAEREIADARANEAANDCYRRYVDSFLVTLERFGPLFFSDFGTGGTEPLLSVFELAPQQTFRRKEG